MFRPLPLLLVGLFLLCGTACTTERAVSQAAPERGSEDEGSARAEPEGWLAHRPGDLIAFTQSRHSAAREENEPHVREFTEEVRELGRVDELRRVLTVSQVGQEEFEHRPGRILRRVGEAWLPLLDRDLLTQEEGTERGDEVEGWRVVRRFAHVTPPAGYAGPCAILWWEAERSDEGDTLGAAAWARIARIEERWLLCRDVGEVARDVVLVTEAGQRSALRRERVSAPGP